MGRTIVIGGGIAGLTAGYRLLRAGADVIVLEAGDRAGGKLATVREQGALIELGPDSVFTHKPWAKELIEEIGQGSEVLEPAAQGFSLLVDGRLRPVPRPLARLDTVAPGAFDGADFLGEQDKERAARPADWAEPHERDASVAAFFRARFGERFSKFVAEPLLAGLYSGDPESLGMAALYPRYWRPHEATSPAGGPAFISLRRGMGSLVQALVNRLGDVVRLSSAAKAVERSGASLSVRTSAETFEAESLVLAVPSFAAARLLQGVAPVASELLERQQHASTSVVTMLFPAGAFRKPPEGNGFLVPRSENCALSGCTFSSLKWPGRAPEGKTLLRSFLRHGGPEGALIELDRLFSVTSAPELTRFDTWDRALPQYNLGHLDWLAGVRLALSGLPIALAGASYGGIGVPDCVRQGIEAAAQFTG